MKRFSFKTLLLVVVLVALLLAGVVTPETSRVRALKYIDQTKGTKVELSESSLSENDPRRWIFGKDAGRHIKKLEFPSGLDYSAESLSIEKIIRDSRSLSHLDSLALRSKLPITKKTIESLGRLKALRFVWIELAEIDDEAVLAISKLENLGGARSPRKQVHFENHSHAADPQPLDSVRNRRRYSQGLRLQFSSWKRITTTIIGRMNASMAAQPESVSIKQANGPR